MRGNRWLATAVVSLWPSLLSFTFPETPPGPRQALPPALAVETGSLGVLPYDAGGVKFIAETAQTAGRSAVLELTEMPGYKTAWHQHNNCEESFYVLEGTLTIRLRERTRELASGSYVWIPRGTPHGQGNFSDRPVRLLTTFTPGGFDAFFRDRVELFKSVKPGGATFQSRFDELRQKHARWVQILGVWNKGE